VKTVSFVTYLLRGYSEAIQPHQESISQSIVELLKTCPDNVSTRKELLVATRHVLSAQEFRRGFYTHIDTLLDEAVLVGTGRACFDSLRPLAYSFLAELVHHMRLELSLPQIRRTVYMFSRNVQDASLPLSIQMTCVRLMHHLVESIFRRRNDPSQAADARANLIRILDATVSKFRTIRPQVAALLDSARAAEDAEAAAAAATKKQQDEVAAATGGTDSITKEEPVEPTSTAATGAEPEKEKEPSTAVITKDADGREVIVIGSSGKPQTPAEAIKRLTDTKALVKTLVIGRFVTVHCGEEFETFRSLIKRRRGMRIRLLYGDLTR
jgi:transformation/transcription domain-associated protein